MVEKQEYLYGKFGGIGLFIYGCFLFLFILPAMIVGYPLSTPLWLAFNM